MSTKYSTSISPGYSIPVDRTVTASLYDCFQLQAHPVPEDSPIENVASPELLGKLLYDHAFTERERFEALKGTYISQRRILNLTNGEQIKFERTYRDFIYIYSISWTCDS